MVIVQPVEFEAEEHHRRGGGGDAVLGIGHELGAVAVHGVLVVAEPCVGHDPAGGGFDQLVGADAGEHGPGVEIGEVALVDRLEIGARGFDIVHVDAEGVAIGAVVEVGQIPFGQVAQGIAADAGVEGGAGEAGGHACLRGGLV